MMPEVSLVTVGPGNGSLLLLTGVEGKAARMGHALTLRATDWTCVTTFDGDSPTAVEVRIQLPSLEVVKGEGGVKSLSDKDKRSILDSARKTMKVAKNPEAIFRTTAVQRAGSGWSLLGDLELAGISRQVAVDVTVGEDRNVVASASVLQSAHGISPYTQMLGALQVRDRVDVRLEAEVRV